MEHGSVTGRMDEGADGWVEGWKSGLRREGRWRAPEHGWLHRDKQPRGTHACPRGTAPPGRQGAAAAGAALVAPRLRAGALRGPRRPGNKC